MSFKEGLKESFEDIFRASWDIVIKASIARKWASRSLKGS
jgi:hypothetical protein